MDTHIYLATSVSQSYSLPCILQQTTDVFKLQACITVIPELYIYTMH